MASERQNMSEQEISIKAREHELYVQPNSEYQAGQTVRGLPARDTRRTPSPMTKAILWMVGTVVALLFLAACWRAAAPCTSADRAPRSPRRPEPVANDGDHCYPIAGRLVCGLATVQTFRYSMVLKTMLNDILFKGSTDDDLLPDRSVRPGSQHESVADAIIGGPRAGPTLRVKMTRLVRSRRS